MPITIPNCIRVSMIHTIGLNECVNVFDVAIDEDAALGGMDDLVEAKTLDVMHAWQDHIISVSGSNLTLREARGVDMSSLTGVSFTSPPDPARDSVGQDGSAQAPPNVSYLVHKVEAASRRGERSGRTYYAPVFETGIDDSGGVASGAVSFFGDAFEDFKDAVNGHYLSPIEHDANLATAHRTGPSSYTLRQIARFEIDGRVATQRRRLRD